MFEWLFLLFTPAVPYAAPAPVEDYVGVVAAEAAYTTLLTSAPEPEPDDPAPRPVDPNCPTCKGTGRVRSGDGISWTKCPTCQPLTEPPAPTTGKPELPKAKLTLPPGPFVKPQHSTGLSPAPAPCASGTCPVEKSAPAAALFGAPLIAVPIAPRRFFRRR